MPDLQGKWHYLGPFDNTDNRGFNAEYPPEKEIDLQKTYTGKDDAKIRWNEFAKFRVGRVNDLKLFEKSAYCCVYLYQEIEVKDALTQTARDVTAGRNHPRFNQPATVGPDTATGNGLVDANKAVLVAKAICSVVAIADPELVVLGGGIGQATGFCAAVGRELRELAPVQPELRVSALGVDAYRELGYLPEALRNYLLRLGWSHGDDEIISTQQAIEWFDIDAVGRAPARFDFAKLDNLNGHYIRAAEDERLVALIAPKLEKLVGKPLTDVELGRVREAMPELKLRPKTLAELAANARFLVAPRPIRLDEKAARLLTPDARRLLVDLIDRLRASEWQPELLEAEIRSIEANRDAVVRMLDTLGSKAGSGGKNKSMTLSGDGKSLVALNMFELPKEISKKEGPPANVAKIVRSASARVSESDGKLNISVTVAAEAQKQAEQLAQMVKGLTAMLDLANLHVACATDE